MTEFAEWILQIGDEQKTNDEGDDWVKIPKDIILHKGEDPKEEIVKSTYPDLLQKYRDREFLEERAILCARNEIVEKLNDYIMSQIQGEEVTYVSLDTVCKATTRYNTMENMCPTEFLNNMTFPGIPNHELKLKVGLPVMLLRNINQAAGLCNGTRMTITQLGNRYIEAQIITGTHVGEKVYIPKIVSPSDSKWPFVLKNAR